MSQESCDFAQVEHGQMCYEYSSVESHLNAGHYFAKNAGHTSECYENQMGC